MKSQQHNKQYSKGTIAVTKFIVFLFIYAGISLLWVVMEYVFEGAAHSSSVDSTFAALMAIDFTRDIFRIYKENQEANNE